MTQGAASLTLALIALGLLVAPGTARAADPADFPALEWIQADGASEQIAGSEGVVFVDLFAHY